MKKVSFLFLMLISLLTLMGCGNEEKYLYSDSSDIEVKSSSVDTIARITISDTFRKGGITYYVIQTDKTSDKEWTLSETEYDEIIGLGNDAVDCTVYKLKCSSKLFSQHYSWFWDSNLYDRAKGILHNMKDMSLYDGGVFVKEAYDMNFEYGDYRFSIPHDSEEEWIESKLIIYRYSFMGESEFTEEEINAYMEVMHKVNTEIVSRLQAEQANK